MATASSIIDRLGGNKAVADWLNISRNGVQRWSYPTGKGTGDRIPMKHWARVIEMGAAIGKPVALQELLPTAAVEAAAKPHKRQRPRAQAAA